jgi:microcystin-dependent protein
MKNTMNISTGDFPIGTIIPFAGQLDDDLFENQGWLYCNGNTKNRTSYADLFAIIGTSFGDGDGKSSFNLPDLRGSFLRGVSGDTANDPDAATRTASGHGGNIGNNAGSAQATATGSPATVLKTNSTGDHLHTIDHIPTDNSSYHMAGDYQAEWNCGSKNTDAAGNHTHTIVSGGDKESRAVNAYTFFLIKFA